jgi:hypothetical protein
VLDRQFSPTPNGNIRYQHKTPYRDGTIHVILEALDIIAWLAAPVPKSGVNLTHYNGVFALYSKQRV